MSIRTETADGVARTEQALAVAEAGTASDCVAVASEAGREE